jgi:catechol 2,3-dioxygenase-like lactoylglutathione lyase family enzyme
MAVQLNHTIVAARDKAASARFLADVLGLAAPGTYGPFSVVELANGVSLDFMDDAPVHPRHYAFLVSEAEFDEILGRIRSRDLEFWADPFERQPGQINHHDGGRGVYWHDPDGHVLEIITRPYGG